MKHLVTQLTAGLLVAFAGIATGCSADGGGRTPTIRSDIDTNSGEFKALATAQLNAYANALIERDSAALEEVLSSEVKSKLASYEGGVERFMEKQRTTLLKAFPALETEGAIGAFEVTKASAQEGVASATLSYQGTEIPRPFYFVAEGDRYKLNVAAPGFSKPLGKGALANDTYRVSSQYGSDPSQVICSYGGTVNTTSPQYIGQLNNYYVSCPNVCGFWSGANFRSFGSPWSGPPNCDYNTWGTDVWVWSNGFAGCNDPC
jgi:hypothetical protein